MIEHARIAERARKELAEAKRRYERGNGSEPMIFRAATLALLAYETLAGQVIQGENDV